MMSVSRTVLRALAVATTLAVGFGLSAGAFAEPPAKLAPANAGHSDAHNKFQAFAKSWMAKQEASEARMKRAASGPGATARGVSDDFKIELRPTGNARAPYVGILRYTEQTYDCAGKNGCTVRDNTPVMEIFRFQGGRWHY